MSFTKSILNFIRLIPSEHSALLSNLRHSIKRLYIIKTSLKRVRLFKT